MPEREVPPEDEHQKPAKVGTVRTLSTSLLVALVLGLVVGCGGDGAADSPAVTDEQTTRAPDVEATSEPEAEAKMECLAVPSDLLAGIAEGLTVQGGGSLRRGKAVRSDDPEGFLIAADIQGPGLEGDGDIGVWAISGELSLLDAGLVFAVDSVAQEFSDWGAATAEGSQAAQLRDAFRDSPAFEQARDCVG